MRSEFTLTESENKVLDCLVENAGGGPAGHLLYPDSPDQKRHAAMLFWRMMGDRLRFIPESAQESIDGDPLKFTAEQTD